MDGRPAHRAMRTQAERAGAGVSGVASRRVRHLSNIEIAAWRWRHRLDLCTCGHTRRWHYQRHRDDRPAGATARCHVGGCACSAYAWTGLWQGATLDG